MEAARAPIRRFAAPGDLCVHPAIPVPGLEHRQAVKDILRANADLARLGGLFKLALSGGGDKITPSRLLREIGDGQRELKIAAMRIR